MRRVVILVVLALTVAGCTGDNGTTTNPEAAEETVTIAGFAFDPSSLTVPVGTVVTWVNEDTTAHTATSDADVFDSGNIDAGADFSFTFDEAGEFPFICTIHPTMTGTITVEG